ncbi:MAG: nucleotidyltransferase domain-containing protein [Epsilonproteobacteria bacterium]|nr:MAG: nucleotidyltransferase domain-containing protein [Campylobacterota bacterium]
MRATKENIITFLQELKPQLLKDGINNLALFGSFATNSQGVYSDIDIAIGKENDFLINNSSYSYFDTISEIKEKIRKKFHRNIDIIDLDSNSSLLDSIKKDLIYV